MSNEVRIGLLALVAIGLSLWGIKFIQGTNIFSKNETFYAYYDNVAGVQVGTPVQISGINVGSVSSLDLGIEDKRVKLSFTLERKVPMPKSTKAKLMQVSLLGDMAIVLDYDQPCAGANCAVDGDELAGVSLGMVESILGEGGLETYVEQLTGGLGGVIDSLNATLLGEGSTGPIAETARNLQGTMANLNAATGRMNTLLQRTAPSLEQSLGNISQLTSTLEQQRQHIAGVLANADTLSQQIVDAQLDDAIAQVKGTVAELSKTLESANTAMTGLNGVVGKIEAGEGSLGMLVQDEALYRNLNALSYSLDSLASDMQDRPYRYIPLKSRRRVQRYDRKDGQ